MDDDVYVLNFERGILHLRRLTTIVLVVAICLVAYLILHGVFLAAFGAVGWTLWAIRVTMPMTLELRTLKREAQIAYKGSMDLY